MTRTTRRSGTSYRAPGGSRRGVNAPSPTTGGTTRVTFGETRLKGGRVRIIGALLPMPTKKFDHPFGLADYGLTYSGYQMLQNALTWTR